MRAQFPLLSIIFLQGGECIQFFVKWTTLACVLDYSNQNPNQLNNNSCTTIGRNIATDFDYQLTHTVIHDLFEPYSTYTLKGSPFNTSSETINTYKYVTDIFIEGFSVDWIHNTVYIVLDRIVSAPLTKSDQIIQLYDVITRDDVASFIGASKKGMNIQEVKIDPYRGYLFVLVSRSVFPDTEVIVLRSDLSGKQLYKVLSTLISKHHCKFFVDINDMKLYVALHGNMYIYNYNGDMVREFSLPYSIIDMSVFNGSIYLTTYPQVNRTSEATYPYENNIIYEIVDSQSEAPFKVKNVYHLSKSGDCTVRILDARVQRRKEDGKYVCDRTDCPELCEVGSSGDSCVCFHSKAKTRDGVMCYNCGQSNLTSLVQEPTIVNGQVSYPSNFPWQAVIYKTTNLEQVCGGTLISSKAVLTDFSNTFTISSMTTLSVCIGSLIIKTLREGWVAAHCVTLTCPACTPSVMKPEELKVALGKTKRSWNISEPYDVRRNVSKILVRDGFTGTSTNYANDIALVIMDSKVSINSYVMPACLDYNLNQLPSYDTLTGYVSGFGFTKDCGRSCSNFSNTLLYTTGTPINLGDCLKALNDIDLSIYHRLTSDKYCMGNGTASAVQKGDSGGGLTSVYRGLHYLTGVVSVKLINYDEDMNLKYSFGGFTNVSVHMNWLKQTLMEE